jgi:uncharacterized protein YcbX
MSTAVRPNTTTKTYAITGLYVYPVKGCAGFSVDSAVITARGFENDRLYLIVRPDGTFLTQREYPKLSLIVPTLKSDGLLFQAPSSPDIDVPFRTTAGLRSVKVWRDECQAYDQGEEIANWLTAFIGTECGLVRMSDDHNRIVDQAYGQPKDIVSFADGFPFLITNDASLMDLNDRLETPVPMDRFRPSIVVNADVAFEEDNWKAFRTDDTEIEIVKNCARCVVTTVNQKTAERGKEPLKTLSTFRTFDGNRVIFGQNAVPRKMGTLRLGEQARIST